MVKSNYTLCGVAVAASSKATTLRLSAIFKWDRRVATRTYNPHSCNERLVRNDGSFAILKSLWLNLLRVGPRERRSKVGEFTIWICSVLLHDLPALLLEHFDPLYTQNLIHMISKRATNDVEPSQYVQRQVDLYCSTRRRFLDIRLYLWELLLDF